MKHKHKHDHDGPPCPDCGAPMVNLSLLKRDPRDSCTTWYQPSGRALEYGPYATAPYSGCGYCCIFCYVPGALHIDRADFNEPGVLREGYFPALKRDLLKYEAAGIFGQGVIAFTTDPAHPGDITPTGEAIEMAHKHGQSICLLSKGGTRVLRFLPLLRPDRDCIAATLTCPDTPEGIRVSQRIEAKAALPGDRLDALRQAHDDGFFTWGSGEPIWRWDWLIGIVEDSHRFVDHWKIGGMNVDNNDLNSKAQTSIEDDAKYTPILAEMLWKMGKLPYFKRDLQPHLTPEQLARNFMRIKQHR